MVARVIGYGLWGVGWVIAFVGVELVLGLVVLSALDGRLRPEAGWIWLLMVPLCAYLFVICPWWMFGQLALGFTLAGQAVSPRYRGKKLGRFVGGAHPTLEALIETPVTRFWTVIGNVGFFPGWLLCGAALVLTMGAILGLFVPNPTVAVAGIGLVVVGAVMAAIGIRSRIVRGFAQPWTDGGRIVLSANYYKGLAYREGKRARDLQKARDAGRAPGATADDVRRWGAAEAVHALRAHPMAKNQASKGVVGSLDAPIADVLAAMGAGISRAQATEFVLDAATFRGRRPTSVIS